jgi:hypothetical protein
MFDLCSCTHFWLVPSLVMCSCVTTSSKLFNKCQCTKITWKRTTYISSTPISHKFTLITWNVCAIQIMIICFLTCLFTDIFIWWSEKLHQDGGHQYLQPAMVSSAETMFEGAHAASYCGHNKPEKKKVSFHHKQIRINTIQSSGKLTILRS